MTEYTDSFESLPGDWVVRNPSTAQYTVTARWEAKDPAVMFAGEKAQLGTFALAKKTAEVDFEDPLAQTITGVREFDVFFYMGVFYSGETSEPTIKLDCYLDNGNSGDGNPLFWSGDDIAADLFGLTVSYDYAAGVANHKVSINYAKNGGSVIEKYSFNPDASEMPRATDTVQWFGFRLIFKDDEIKLYTDFDNSSVWILKTTLTNINHITADLTQVVLNPSGTQSGGHAIHEMALVDNFRLGTGDDIQDIDSNIQGLSLGTAKIITLTALQEGGAQGLAQITISDPGLKNWAVLKSNQNNLVTIRDNTYNRALLIGEVKPINIIDQHTVKMTIQHNSRKVLKQRCNYNPVLYSNFIKYVEDNDIYDHVDNLSPVVAGHALTVEKVALTTMKIYPRALTEDHGPIGGNIFSLYQPGNILDYGDDDAFFSAETIFDFYIYVTDVTEVSEVLFDLIYQINAESGGYSASDPTWYVYNGATYDALRVVTDTESDGEDGAVKQLSHINLSLADAGTISDYFNDAQAANDSGYKRYTLKLKFDVGIRCTSCGAPSHHYAFDIVKLTMKTSTNQPLTVGQGLLDSGGGTDQIILDNIGPAWALASFPASEGIGEGDQYYITRFLDTIMDNIFINAATNFTYSQNITGISDQVIFNRDISFESILSALNKVQSVMNAPWWLNPSTNIIEQVSIDNLSSNGLTITEADFIGIPNYLTDPSQIRSKVTVIGKNDTYSSDITEEFGLDGGEEEEILTDGNLSNTTAINNELAALVKRHTNAKVSVTGTLNFGNPEQSYANLTLYSTLAFTMADIDGNNIISHTSPELTVVKLRLRNSAQTGYQDWMEIWLLELIE